MTRDEARQEIEKLVEKYKCLSNKDVKGYNEANTKQAFILPLFAALGWNIYDTAEVALEENASNGRVDFAFKINNVARLYVEAKKLGADLTSSDYIKQAVTYAYNNSVTWAVLTNFTEIRLFNAQKSWPFISLNYEEYVSSFDKLWLLSRQSQMDGLLDKEATQYGALPPLVPIEEKLFKQLQKWREALYNELFHYNEWLEPEHRDEVIEKLFNRMIFIRTAEDRNLEEHKLLAAVHQWKNNHHKKGELTAALHDICIYFNGYYDSDLFKQHLIDDSRLYIDEHLYSDIITGLYDIPGGMASYDFSLIDADVLGRVYEQYLGYVSKHVAARVKTEKAKEALGYGSASDYKLIEKKKHRKDQGIYYTPKFVTDYIVKETVGRFIHEHNHNEIMNMKILDPACGSGSFLIRAYDELLNYYADQKGKAASQLDQFERLPVLTQNIFGVDLDQQAVEIARLNLLLRALAKREILPPLTENIKRGNSLISGADEELEKYFGANWRDKHPFNWETEFKDIMESGGFDVVIGNPPYGAEFDEQDRHYLEQNYPYSSGNKNSAMVFIEKGLRLTKEGGYFSFIIPKSLAYSQKWSAGRKLLLDNLGKAYDASKAFREVLLEQMVVVVSQKFSRNHYYEATYLKKDGAIEKVQIDKAIASTTDTILLGISEKELEIFHKLTTSNYFMKDISKTARGLPFQKYLIKDPCGIPAYRGDNIGRYILHDPAETLPEAMLAGTDKKVSYLRQKKILSQQIIAHVTQPRDHIILMSTLDTSGVITLDTVQNTILTDSKYDYLFVTGLLNSTLWSWYAYKFIYSNAIRTMHFDEYYVHKFPLPRINFNNTMDIMKINKLSSLVENIITLKNKLTSIRNDYSHEMDDVSKEIEKTDKNIDTLVYDIYNLTEDERLLVGGKKTGLI